MWRLTGVIKWYPNRNIMTTFDYGIARLHRDQLYSTTRIFQLRLLLWL